MRSTGNLHELWRTGHELDYAWRVVPDPDLQLQYRASHDNYRKREFAISLMKRELAELACYNAYYISDYLLYHRIC
jgi:hypothetical protein